MSNNTYSLEHIILLESSFKREWILALDNPDFSSTIDIGVSDERNDTHINVIVILKFSSGIGEEEQISAHIKMVGVFALPESSELSVDKFANINAPAIIFPFLREHLASLSIKAGLDPILLQPVNFVSHSENKTPNK